MSVGPGSRRCGRWFSGRRRLIAGCSALAIVLPLNLMAYVHARAMTSYSAGGERSPPPERLSALGKVQVFLTGINLPRPVNVKSPAELGLSYQTHIISRKGGLDLEAWRIPGDGLRPVVIMFHGYGSCKDQLLDEASAFHELGCETVLVDFRGSGGSAGNETTLGVYEADDVAMVVDFAKKSSGTRPLILYGKSMGRRPAGNERVRPQPRGIRGECALPRFVAA